MSEKMLAAVLHGSRELKLQQAVVPTPRTGQVRLQTRRAGICGSDLHYFAHGRCGAFVPTQPFILGHEFVAEVEQLGAGVDSLELGQRVTVNPAASCGQCHACKSGRCNLCENIIMLGSASTTPPTDGAFAEYVVVPAHQCHVLPDSLDDAVATLMEPLSVVLHAIRRAGELAGRSVLVAGGGPIGLLTARTAQAFGATLVAVSEPAEQRRAAAIRLAADLAFDPTSEDFVASAREASDGGFDVVFEASGAAPAVQSALAVARRGGTVVQIGTIGAPEVTLPFNDVMVRELNLLGSFRYVDEFHLAIELCSSGRLDLAPFVSAVYPMTEIAAAIDQAGSGGDVVKVQLTV